MYGPYMRKEDTVTQVVHLKRLNKGAPNATYTIRHNRRGYFVDVDSSRDTSR